MLKYWFKKYCGRTYSVEAQKMVTSYAPLVKGHNIRFEANLNRFGTWDTKTCIERAGYNLKEDVAKEQGLSFEKAIEKLKDLEGQILETYGGRKDFDNYVAEIGKGQEKKHICNVLWRLSMQDQRTTELKYLKSGKNRPSN